MHRLPSLSPRQGQPEPRPSRLPVSLADLGQPHRPVDVDTFTRPDDFDEVIPLSDRYVIVEDSEGSFILGVIMGVALACAFLYGFAVARRYGHVFGSVGL